MLSMEGSLTQLIFRNAENGYTVGVLDTEDGEITIVGTLADAQVGEYYHLEGEIIYHTKYGEQFKIRQAVFSMPKTETALIKYLSSGLIPYVGEATAKKIVKLLGVDALEAIDADPMVLLKVKGLGKKRIRAIAEALEKQKHSRDVIVYLQDLGISANQAVRIYTKYREETAVRVKENPYQLIDDIYGIGFGFADELAKRIGIRSESEFRVHAGIRYLLSSAASVNGDCFLERDEVIQRASELLNLPAEIIDRTLDALIIEGKIVQDSINEERVLYFDQLYAAEERVATKLVQMLASGEDYVRIRLEGIEREEEIVLDEKQARAVREALENKIVVITGGPGTGKTTIIKRLMTIAEGEGLDLKLCAPTGRAAKRMEESTGASASTIHRLLKYKMDEEGGYMHFEHDRNHPITADMIIVDEASMIDIELMEKLMDAIPLQTRLVLVGDVDQLPSVGPGNVLRDILSSGLVRTIVLDCIYRQSDGSNIVVNAHRINKGEFPILNEEGKDFFFIRSPDPRETKKTVVELLRHRLPKYYGLSAIRDIQVLTPMKKGEVGLLSLNRELQNALNPETADMPYIEWSDRIFRPGDKVMQVVNNYNLSILGEDEVVTDGVYNGDMGIVEEIDPEEALIRVRFDEGGRAEYDRELFNDLLLSYAITIHKSQGSEFKAVVIPLHYAPLMLMTRNLLYTAITRAKSLVVLVGEEEILRKMIAHNPIHSRNSSLAERMHRKMEIYGGV